MRNTFFKSLSIETFVAVFFAVIALVSLSFFLFPGTVEKKTEQKTAGAVATPTRTPSSPSPTTKPSEASPNEVQLPETEDEEETLETKTVQVTIVVTPTPQPPSDKAIISVSIDGASSFTVSLDKGKNQCDVLTQAKNENKLTQLLMKYDNSLDSYGVYQINNLGKDNTVWWAYTVNGKSPGKGCNHIAANNGDHVTWTYVGSR